MMRVLFDTNVVLDVLLQREPWVSEASALWQADDEGRITGYMIASAVADVFYIARRLVGLEMAQQAIQTCLDAFEICPVDRWDLERAKLLPGNDFEDNLQIACATTANLDAIVTRNPDHFKTAPMSVLIPSDALARIS
jgi:predicted nucleic acid-binding protein